VVVYDRHLADALVMLDTAYPGVDLRRAEMLIRRFLPPAAFTLYLEVPPDVAATRKPDDAFGQDFIRRQIDRYGVRLKEVRPLVRLDGTRPEAEVASDALRLVLEGN
jgi:thymidylate kinase